MSEGMQRGRRCISDDLKRIQNSRSGDSRIGVPDPVRFRSPLLAIFFFACFRPSPSVTLSPPSASIPFFFSSFFSSCPFFCIFPWLRSPLLLRWGLPLPLFRDTLPQASPSCRLPSLAPPIPDLRRFVTPYPAFAAPDVFAPHLPPRLCHLLLFIGFREGRLVLYPPGCVRFFFYFPPPLGSELAIPQELTLQFQDE